jgi:hypothetical protein
MKTKSIAKTTICTMDKTIARTEFCVDNLRKSFSAMTTPSNPHQGFRVDGNISLAQIAAADQTWRSHDRQ